MKKYLKNVWVITGLIVLILFSQQPANAGTVKRVLLHTMAWGVGIPMVVYGWCEALPGNLVYIGGTLIYGVCETAVIMDKDSEAKQAEAKAAEEEESKTETEPEEESTEDAEKGDA